MSDINKLNIKPESLFDDENFLKMAGINTDNVKKEEIKTDDIKEEPKDEPKVEDQNLQDEVKDETETTESINTVEAPENQDVVEDDIILDDETDDEEVIEEDVYYNEKRQLDDKKDEALDLQEKNNETLPLEKSISDSYKNNTKVLAKSVTPKIKADNKIKSSIPRAKKKRDTVSLRDFPKVIADLAKNYMGGSNYVHSISAYLLLKSGVNINEYKKDLPDEVLRLYTAKSNEKNTVDNMYKEMSDLNVKMNHIENVLNVLKIMQAYHLSDRMGFVNIDSKPATVSDVKDFASDDVSKVLRRFELDSRRHFDRVKALSGRSIK